MILFMTINCVILDAFPYIRNVYKCNIEIGNLKTIYYALFDVEFNSKVTKVFLKKKVNNRGCPKSGYWDLPICLYLVLMLKIWYVH